MPRMRKTAKPKLPTYERIDRKADKLGVYPVLDAVLKTHHTHLLDKDCRIALAWRQGLRPNKDGQLMLGMCKKVTDLDKQYAGYDFIVILNKEAWERMEPHQRTALIDHELCHAAVSYDQNGNPKTDARGRQVFRTKKHDVEEFGEVIARHGCYKADLEQFVLLAMQSRRPPQPGIPGIDEPPATIPMPSANGTQAPGDRDTQSSLPPDARPVPAAARKTKAKA